MWGIAGIAAAPAGVFQFLKNTVKNITDRVEKERQTH